MFVAACSSSVNCELHCFTYRPENDRLLFCLVRKEVLAPATKFILADHLKCVDHVGKPIHGRSPKLRFLGPGSTHLTWAQLRAPCLRGPITISNDIVG
jgi:hypothetical protein